ncbi:related to O-methylsterigmatocystin oxidoreductase [Phialocephala subalpina]|uniref:Related to O-methylsterigmatocystin oxidoreductase n=1 Tax=Phialocephala subalpina TaxID=576137 RepID=A0A1L7XLQ1_9HELO|nr:related to O-methylsterigmatocystin oxidoreductase [Phialocephala subalpina]
MISTLSQKFGEMGNEWLIFCVACIGIIGISKFLMLGMRPKNYPPGICQKIPNTIKVHDVDKIQFLGPPTLPIIGNLHQLPKKDIHLAYDRWAKQYGPIFSLKLGNTTTIVLANGDTIKKLVDKRSANYADRQSIYMRDLYDDLWKVERKLYHNFLNINVAKKYHPYQSLEMTRLCVDLLQDPVNFFAHISRATSSIGSSMTYGFRLNSMEDHAIKELNRNTHGFFGLVLQSKFLDWYPIFRPLVKLLPIRLNPLAAKATDFYHRERTHFRKLYLDVKANMYSEGVMLSFACDIAKAQETWKGTSIGDLLTDKAASYIAGISFEGGADTSRNTLIGFIKAMAIFQDAQKQAQEEIDRVVGPDRMPNMDDFDQLPFVRCTMKEALRWMPVAITGAIPHATREEDEFEGYHIPKGAGIVMAVWSANNDTNLFTDPRVFNPARHSSKTSLAESAASKDYRDRDQWTFGAGRRMCPGIHVAERTLFIAISRLLWTFSITKDQDMDGNEIYIPPDEVDQSLAACPPPFKCKIVPRDGKRTKIVVEEWAKATALLDGNGNYKTPII